MWSVLLVHRHIKQPVLSEYLDGRLRFAASRRVERAIAQCSQCREELESLRAAVLAVRAVPDSTPPRSFVMDAPPPVTKSLPRAQPSLVFRLPQWTYAGVAATAALVLAVLLSADAAGLLAPSPVTEEAVIAETAPHVVGESAMAKAVTAQVAAPPTERVATAPPAPTATTAPRAPATSASQSAAPVIPSPTSPPMAASQESAPAQTSSPTAAPQQVVSQESAPMRQFLESETPALPTPAPAKTEVLKEVARPTSSAGDNPTAGPAPRTEAPAAAALSSLSPIIAATGVPQRPPVITRVNTQTPPPTATPSPTSTPPPTPTPTPSPTPTPTKTPAPTQTPTPTPKPTNTPIPPPPTPTPEPSRMMVTTVTADATTATLTPAPEGLDGQRPPGPTATAPAPLWRALQIISAVLALTFLGAFLVRRRTSRSNPGF